MMVEAFNCGGYPRIKSFDMGLSIIAADLSDHVLERNK